VTRDIFICHASEDAAAANALVAGLEDAGITCWVAPRDVMPGADYAQAIVAGISRAKAMVLVFSTHSNLSQQVGREVERAVSRGIDIIPFRVEEIEPAPSLEYFISTSQWLDATGGPVEEHVGELTKTIRILVYGQEGDATRQAAGDVLWQIIEQYGPALAEDPRRVRSLLRDMAGEHRAEVAALVAAAEEGVGSALLQSTEGLAPDMVQRLTRRLQDNRALTEEASRWAVAAWSHALGMDEPPTKEPVAPVTGGLPETVAAVAARHPSTEPPETVAAPEAPVTEATVPAPPRDRRAVAPGGQDVGQATVPATRAAPTHSAPLPTGQPPGGSGRRWVAAALVGAVAVAGIVGGATLFGGDELEPGNGTSTTQAPPATTVPQLTTVPRAAFFSLDGLTVADVVSRWPAEAASIGLTEGCATLLQLEPVDVATDRLAPGETFVWGRFGAPFCDSEIWGIQTPGGTLRELTVQIETPSGQAVEQMMDVAMALVGTVDPPESSGTFARSALDEFGWLSASDPASHQDDAVLGAIQLGTFLHDAGFTFYMVPAG
jgi:hypothetical protein